MCLSMENGTKIKSSSTSVIRENVLKRHLEHNKKKNSELGQNVLWSKTFRLEQRGGTLKIKKDKMS